MLGSLRRRGTLVLVLGLICALAWLVVGCAGDDESSSTTSTDGSTVTTAPTTTETTLGITGTTLETAGNVSTTGTTTAQRAVAGGKTPEEYAKALPDLKKAVAADPADLAALQELALALYNTNNYAEAATAYQGMLQVKDDAFTRNNYANVLRDWGKIAEAKAEYEKAIKTDPTLAIAYINLASILETEGNIAEAKKVVDRGIAATTGQDKTTLQNYKKVLGSTTTTT